MARSFTVERQLRGFHAVVIDPVYQVGTVISAAIRITSTGAIRTTSTGAIRTLEPVS